MILTTFSIRGLKLKIFDMSHEFKIQLKRSGYYIIFFGAVQKISMEMQIVEKLIWAVKRIK